MNEDDCLRQIRAGWRWRNDSDGHVRCVARRHIRDAITNLKSARAREAEIESFAALAPRFTEMPAVVA